MLQSTVRKEHPNFFGLLLSSRILNRFLGENLAELSAQVRGNCAAVVEVNGTGDDRGSSDRNGLLRPKENPKGWRSRARASQLWE